jgi:DNA polymerase-3 subunit delta
MILSKRPDVERFLREPTPDIRAVVLYGKDRGVVRDRANALAKRVVERPDDPFDTAMLTDGDLDADPAKLEDELSAMSLMGGRRLVRLRLNGEKAGPDKQAAEALTRHVEGQLNPDAFFLVEAGALGRESQLRKVGEKANGCAVIPCYEDEAGDLARLARDTLANDKVSLNGEALDLFVSRLPKERGVARAEIERLALYLGPGSGVTATAADLTRLSRRRAGGLAQRRRRRRVRWQGRPRPTGPAPRRRRGRRRSGRGPRHRLLSGPPAARADPAQERRRPAGRRQGRRRLLETGARVPAPGPQPGTWKSILDIQGEILTADRACKTSGSPDQLIAERLALMIAGSRAAPGAVGPKTPENRPFARLWTTF